MSSAEDLWSGVAPLKDLRRPMELIRQFTPNWFAAVMGTGIVALALNEFVSTVPALHSVAFGLWLLNAVIFILMLVIYAARWILFFQEAKRILDHSVVSMYFGCIPMALATVINGLVIFATPAVGTQAIDIAVWLWIVDVIIAIACGIAVPFLMFTRQQHSTEGMTAIWLLPIVAGEVAASSGAVLADHLSLEPGAQMIVLVSYILWGFSVPMAFCIMAILVLRLSLHKLPPTTMAPSMFLTLGPIGTGALGVLALGTVVLKIPSMALHAASLHSLGMVGGLVLWGVGVWWIGISVLSTIKYFKRGLPFNLGWWGYVFPLGVFSIATLRLGEVTGRQEFWWVAVVLVALLTVAWSYIFWRTVKGAYSGTLFVAPCLSNN
ncbi:TDT family transporter [Agrobacterium tumefaciens]|nr:TDT family transporter [Agrobacterium tumefaciens]HZG27979.1 TDT family transporter [Ensifer sp.]